MYDGNLEEAYLTAAESYLEGARYDRAIELCRKVLELKPRNRKARALIKKAEQASPAQTS